MRSNLERQNRELREKLEENEEFGKGKSRAMLGALEAKVHALEEQLDGEVRYVEEIGLARSTSFVFVGKNKKLVDLFVHLKNVFVTRRVLRMNLENKQMLTKNK